jgi:hypothetical protein
MDSRAFAPEVIEYSNLPERRRAGDAEGLQRASDKDWKHQQTSAFLANRNDDGSVPGQEGRSLRWRTVILYGICAAAVALGAGIGIGYAVGNNVGNTKGTGSK